MLFEFLNNCKISEGGASYICFLSNPQHLDISRLTSQGPKHSPFYQVLQTGAVKHMHMLSTVNTQIHNRLWCAYEAFTAQALAIPVDLCGSKIALLLSASINGDITEMGDLEDGDNVYFDDDSFLAKKLPHCRGVANIVRVVDHYNRFDIKAAGCFSQEDKRAIHEDIGEENFAKVNAFLAGMIDNLPVVLEIRAEEEEKRKK